MGRFVNASLNVAVNFLVGYVLGRLVWGKRAGVKLGLALGLVGFVGSWVLADRLGEADVDELRRAAVEGDEDAVLDELGA